MCVYTHGAPSACVFSTARSCDLAAILRALNKNKQYPESERIHYVQIALLFFSSASDTIDISASTYK